MKDIDRYRGCLIGGAAGDALGYAVEFDDVRTIFQTYGKQGITAYDPVGGAAIISDDTQMTLFTANGLLLGATCQKGQGDTKAYPLYISCCYMDWLKTQMTDLVEYKPPEYAWLNNLPALNRRRAPGNTCLNALLYRKLGSVEHPSNTSSGCGGVMRVAPIGLFFDEDNYTVDEIDWLGAEAAALTHGHELGYLPAAMLVHIVYLLAHDAQMTVSAAVEDAKLALVRLFPDTEHLRRMLALTDKAVRLAEGHNGTDLDAIRQLGEGWTGEEALVIALYCALRYPNDFESAMIAAVNHSGDSDSTGAIAGNILGAHLGMQGIPEKFLTGLELKDTILEIADDLFSASALSGERISDPIWQSKYVRHTYPNE